MKNKREMREVLAAVLIILFISILTYRPVEESVSYSPTSNRDVGALLGSETEVVSLLENAGVDVIAVGKDVKPYLKDWLLEKKGIFNEEEAGKIILKIERNGLEDAIVVEENGVRELAFLNRCERNANPGVSLGTLEIGKGTVLVIPYPVIVPACSENGNGCLESSQFWGIPMTCKLWGIQGIRTCTCI